MVVLRGIDKCNVSLYHYISLSMHKELDILTPCYASCKLSFDFDCSHDTKLIESDNLTPIYDVSE